MIRAAILALLLASGAGGAQADALSSLVDRYVAWRGGGAFEALRSFRLHGDLDTAGLHGTEDLFAQRDGRVRVDVDLGVLKQTQVVAPGQSWDIAPGGQVETMGQGDRQSIGRDAALQFADALRGRGGAMAVLAAPESRDGRTWAVVRVSFGDADVYDVLIDPESGALGGFHIVEDRKARFEGFGDWRMVDGVRMPFLQTVKTEAPGGDQSVKVASLALNGEIDAVRLARPAPARHAVFSNGARSTGWIDFEYFGGNRIFFPARVNGHDVVVLLDSGATVSGIDRAYAARIGLQPQGGFTAPGTGGVDTMGFVGGLDIQVGELTLHGVNAAALDFAPVAQRIGHPIPFVLGDEVFNELAVDIDFAHRRIAFRNPEDLAKPDGAVEVPLNRVFGNRSVPVSIEGAAPVQCEFDLGNGSPLEIYPAYYQPHRLLEGRPTSKVMAGSIGGFHPWSVATLDRIAFVGIDFPRMPAEFTPDTLSGANSNVVVCNVGLPILSRFRLVVDYSHDRLYAAAYPGAAAAPFPRDRLGLSLAPKGGELVVEFVSPGGPGEAAGFKVGDRIAMIDHRPAPAWSGSDLAQLRHADAGTTVAFTLGGGQVRRVTLAAFY